MFFSPHNFTDPAGSGVHRIDERGGGTGGAKVFWRYSLQLTPLSTIFSSNLAFRPLWTRIRRNFLKFNEKNSLFRDPKGGSAHPCAPHPAMYASARSSALLEVFLTAKNIFFALKQFLDMKIFRKIYALGYFLIYDKHLTIKLRFDVNILIIISHYF